MSLKLDELKPHDRVQMRYVLRREKERRVGTVERVSKKSVTVVWDNGFGVQNIQSVGLLEAAPPSAPAAEPRAGEETKK